MNHRATNERFIFISLIFFKFRKRAHPHCLLNAFFKRDFSVIIMYGLFERFFLSVGGARWLCFPQDRASAPVGHSARPL